MSPTKTQTPAERLAQFEHDNAYHAPGPYEKDCHERVNWAIRDAGRELIDACPVPSRGLSLALTKLEEARMWANQAIATAPRAEENPE